MAKERAQPPEEHFAERYARHRDAPRAAREVGVAEIVLTKTIQRWMSNPAIRDHIDLLTNEMDPLSMISEQQIIAGFLDIVNDPTSPATVKNGALKELAKLKGMYPGDMGDPEDAVPGTMLIPDSAGRTEEEWTAFAMEQQRILKEDVQK